MSVPEYLSASARPIELLLVEDDDDDVFFIRKSLASDRLLIPIHRVEDGVEALEYLRREGKFANAKRPDLILLDLNMPRKNGHELLQELREDPEIRDIPVVLLTASHDDLDVLQREDEHAYPYLTKPLDIMQLRTLLQTLNGYWFSMVKLPASECRS